MPFEVHLTIAEDIIGATDAALQKNDGVDENLVAQFRDIPVDNARNALYMAEQLGLVRGNQAGEYIPIFPYAVYLITSNLQQKAAIFRLVLEQYLPYKTFKVRLTLTGLAPEAANQTRAIHNITAHREVILSTLLSLGTFANSLISEGAGLYKAAQSDTVDYLAIVNDVIQNRESAELHVRRRIGIEATDWIDQQEVFSHLVTAYQRAAAVNDDPKSPIVHAGNAIESFLVQLAGHYNVNLQNATGINSKADRLAQANHITSKHKNMIKYLGHVRNAADHGTDQEIGQAWEISPNTAVEYVHVAQTTISDIVSHLNNRFII